MELLSELITSFDPSNPYFRPTELYNENWLLKLVLHQASMIPDEAFPLGFLPHSTWFSEALLPTAFKARQQGDRLGESWTNADGVIGHFSIGVKGKADLELENDAKQFTVVEAKMGSPLSKGTSNAKYFDQAARNVACMAEVLYRAMINPLSFDRLGFIVIAPEDSLEKGTFLGLMTSDSILRKVRRRVKAYTGDLDRWYQQAFLPLMKVIDLQCLSWENVIDWIRQEKPVKAEQLKEYYELCLEFN